MGPCARPATPRLARAGLIVLGLAVLAGAAAQAAPPTHWTTRFGVPTVTLRLIPRGACVITDSAVYLLIANRFTSDVPGCSQMVDSLGTDLALGDGRFSRDRALARCLAVSAGLASGVQHRRMGAADAEKLLSVYRGIPHSSPISTATSGWRGT